MKKKIFIKFSELTELDPTNAAYKVETPSHYFVTVSDSLMPSQSGSLEVDTVVIATTSALTYKTVQHLLKQNDFLPALANETFVKWAPEGVLSLCDFTLTTRSAVIIAQTKTLSAVASLNHLARRMGTEGQNRTDWPTAVLFIILSSVACEAVYLKQLNY